MREKSVLLKQSLAIAHGAVMALDEDLSIARGDDACRGKGAWADGEDADGFAKRGKLSQKRAQFGERERRPVGLDQRAVHAVSLCDQVMLRTAFRRSYAR